MSAPQIYPPDTGSRGREPFRGRAVPYHEQDATAHWIRHYRNELTILWLLRGATRQETRIDLRRQLEVCRRKQAHWQRHANWDVTQATRLAAEAKDAAAARRPA